MQKPVSPQHWEDITDDNNNNDPNFDRKLDIITAGALPHIKEYLLTKLSKENCRTIVDYILAMQTEVSPSDSYRTDTIVKLRQLAEFHHNKPFRQMIRQDVIDFLDSLRKPEQLDPMHKWIGTYEVYRIVLMRFFKWLHAPDIPQKQRPKPAIIEKHR